MHLEVDRPPCLQATKLMLEAKYLSGQPIVFAVLRSRNVRVILCCVVSFQILACNIELTRIHISGVLTINFIRSSIVKLLVILGLFLMHQLALANTLQGTSGSLRKFGVRLPNVSELGVFDRYRHNALHRAAKKGDFSTVNAYAVQNVEFDADVLALAISSGNDDLVAAILEYDKELVNRLMVEFMERKDSVVEEIFGPIGSSGKSYRALASRMNNPSVADAFVGANKQKQQKRIHNLVIDALDERKLPEFRDSSPEEKAYPTDTLVFTLARADAGLIKVLTDRGILPLDYSVSNGHHDRIVSDAIKNFNIPVVKIMLTLAQGKRGIPRINYLLRYISGSEVYASLSKEELSALEQKRLEMMDYLVKLGADVNKASNGKYDKGKTPLEEAIMSLQPLRVKFLLENGATSGRIRETLSRAEHIVYERGSPARQIGEKPDSTHANNLSAIRQLLADRDLR